MSFTLQSIRLAQLAAAQARGDERAAARWAALADPAERAEIADALGARASEPWVR